MPSQSLLARYQAFVAPGANGLPSLRVLLGFPIILLGLAAVLVGLGINGSSSGAYYSSIATGDDPALLAGHPQAIRSDEWNTGTSWTISQLQQGLPVRNETFPGGMDAALPYDLPRLDWSVAFRPHLIGYQLLDADHGTAWKWWSIGIAVVAAAYMFSVTLLPRRPLLSVGIAVAFFYSPFFQWWYQASTFWPVVWALVTMTAISWVTRSTSRLSPWLWAIVVAYLTAVMAMGIYVPFIIPVAYVVLFFAVGIAVARIRRRDTWRHLIARLSPIVVAGVVGGAVTVAFLLSRATTVEQFLSTVYPGERLVDTGSGKARAVLALTGSSFTEALDTTGGFLGSNSSDASSFFLIGIFLLPVVLWLVLRARRQASGQPWMLIGVSLAVVLFAAFAFIPGWDGLAHLLLLDRVPIERLRIGFGLASVVLVVGIVAELDAIRRPASQLAALASVGLFLVLQGLTGVLFAHSSLLELLGKTPFWWLYAAAGATAIYFFARHRPSIAVAAYLVATVPASFLINPIYVGVLDLRETTVVQKVLEADEESPGAWVGIGGPVVTAMLVESGVRAYNGVQGAPSPEMWNNVDPGHRYEDQWNRIGFVNWTPAPGEPRVTNPGLADAVVATFDACSTFAQEHVAHVLVDHPVDLPCLREEGRALLPSAEFTLYSVIAP